MGSISVETKRIDELAAAETVGSDNDLLLIRFTDGTGTKNITVRALRKAMTGNIEDLNTEDKASIVAACNEILAEVMDEDTRVKALETILGGSGAGFHNSIYRGRYLGDNLTAEQFATIRAGAFDDLYIGDYWTIGGVNYRIADFDYFLRSGDTECTTHHVVVVPDTALYNAQMNTSNVTTGAYIGSAMYTSNLAQAKTRIESAFGSAHVLSYREYLKNAVTNGYESGGAWYDSNIELMTEQMVYGAPIFSNAVAGTSLAAKYTVACKQLNLFRHRPDLISNRVTYWLRDVVNASCFADVHYHGRCNYNSASYSAGVRPAFPIY